MLCVWVGVWVLVLSCVLRRLIVKESVLKKKVKELPFDGTEARVALRSRFFFFFALNKIAQ
jgi:hypothetical protein